MWNGDGHDFTAIHRYTTICFESHYEFVLHCFHSFRAHWLGFTNPERILLLLWHLTLIITICYIHRSLCILCILGSFLGQWYADLKVSVWHGGLFEIFSTQLSNCCWTVLSCFGTIWPLLRPISICDLLNLEQITFWSLIVDELGVKFVDWWGDMISLEMCFLRVADDRRSWRFDVSAWEAIVEVCLVPHINALLFLIRREIFIFLFSTNSWAPLS